MTAAKTAWLFFDGAWGVPRKQSVKQGQCDAHMHCACVCTNIDCKQAAAAYKAVFKHRGEKVVLSTG